MILEPLAIVLNGSVWEPSAYNIQDGKEYEIIAPLPSCVMEVYENQVSKKCRMAEGTV